MDPLFFMVAAGGALAALWIARWAYGISPRAEARLRRALNEAARRVGLRNGAGGGAGSVARHGVDPSGRLRIELRQYPNAAALTTQITLSEARPAGSGITATARPPGARSAPREGEIELGAEEFDEQVEVRGDALLGHATLDSATRTELAKLLRGSLLDGNGTATKLRATLEKSVLEVRVAHRTSANETELVRLAVDLLERLVPLAHALARPSDLERRLAKRFTEEPEWQARQRLLELLARQFRDSQETHQVLTAALEDPRAEVRLAAAKRSSTTGIPVLLALVADPGTSELCAAGAVLALGEALPAAAAEEALHRALDPAQPELAKACLERLVQAEAPQTEALALQALERSQTALAAAEALGQVGTTAAVPALRSAEDRGPREVSRAARQAVAEIQSRLEGAEAGQLTLAAGDVGALSLTAQDEPGRVSLAENEVPRLVEGPMVKEH